MLAQLLTWLVDLPASQLSGVREEESTGRRKKSFSGNSGKKKQGRTYNFKPAVLVHFGFAADRSRASL